ncbi:MAG: Septum formation initiator [Candidatus Amesbacteria bacterium GW2011_GWC1_47_15]|uniref:Septum formation initiator n=1 Tax=Candidatus Amesbacteria bacterium GW2011_GWC1_47_15 TaxID=1618364 RepID=A0A0G1S1H8_9BACT|nr:MAG: Septum formation initiator [Candidatus Amesbacteria bacterium GW2011_GWC1_47_15]
MQEAGLRLYTKLMQKGEWKGWLIIAIGLYTAWRMGTSVVRLWKAGDRVKQASSELTLAKAENEELKTRLDYVRSPEFVEKEVKERFGWGRPGEEILIIEQQEMSNVQYSIPSGSYEKQEPNWKKWWDLYIKL